MTSILSNFEICANIPLNTKILIKSFYVFKDCFSFENMIYVTKEDKVFGLGHNYCGTLGLGHNDRVKKCTKIKELSHQKINDIYNGWTHVMARNDQNQLFSWGWNIWGQLGRGYKSKVDESLKPSKVIFSQNEVIEDICCGYYHSLALMSDGLLYGWGRNSEGQLGLTNERIVDKPTKLKINETNDLRFKYIYCCNFSSFAITTNGLLFSWGYNENGILGQGQIGEKCIPRVVDLFNVHKICSSESNSYFLTNDGYIYFCGKYDYNNRALIRKTPIKINNPNTIIHDLTQMCGTLKESYCWHSEGLFYRLNQDQLVKMNDKYNTIFELSAIRIGITPQMLHISCDDRIETSAQFIWSHSTIFQVMAIVGSGGFGAVKQCLDHFEKRFYAIKMINILSESYFSI